MASEFCRHLEHRHMVEYRRNYEHRREQHAGRPYFSKDENLEKNYLRSNTQQQKFFLTNFLSGEKEIMENRTQNIKDFNYLKRVENIYQIIPSKDFLEQKVKRHKEKKRQKDSHRVHKHPESVYVLPWEKPNKKKKFYYEGKLEFGDKNYKIQKIYYQNYSIQLGSAFSESISNSNSVFSPTVIVPINRRRTHLQFSDFFPISINQFRQYGVKSYPSYATFVNQRVNGIELETKLEKQKYLRSMLMEENEELDKVQIESEKLNVLEEKQKPEIETKLRKQIKLHSLQLQNALMPTKEMELIEQKRVQEKQEYERKRHAKLKAEHFRLWNPSVKYSRFTKGVTINPPFKNYFKTKTNKVGTDALLRVKNLHANFKTYYKRQKKTREFL